MTNKLGVYWSVMHRRPQDYDYFRRMQPAVFKIMDGGEPDYRWARENLPNSLIIARDWALSEQHDDMLRDPVGTGKRHAREWNDHANRLGFDRAKTLILGINEAKIWEPGVAEALRQYTIALCDEAAAMYGLRVGAMQLSVGWPNNSGADTPPNWSPWHGVEDAILRGNHALVLHEYWADNGPSENWGWWAGRALKCPWSVPIVVGECGVDMYVKSAQFEGNRGWQGRMHPNRYAAELVEYVQSMSKDSRFVGCAVFASDYADRVWWSFDVEPAYEEILSYPPLTPIPVPEPTVNVYVPVATNGATQTPSPVDNFARAIEFVLRHEGGFSTDPYDSGNYRDGVFVGTNFGISANAHPGVDIVNLTREQAIDIYRQSYWIPSGAHMLPWPDCLAVFDLAVNGGIGRADQFRNEVGTKFIPFMARRIEWYTRLEQFDRYGPAWIRRCADLLREGSK